VSPAAFSVLAFGIYLALGGIGLLLAPEALCHVLGLRSPGETMWVRLCGMFFLDLAYYCIRAARSEQTAFIRWSVASRPMTVLFVGAFVAYGLENPAVLAFGVIDLAASLWTTIALRTADRAGTQLPARPGPQTSET
jgi:hypothetical protein